jgi:hypothetical protein
MFVKYPFHWRKLTLTSLRLSPLSSALPERGGGDFFFVPLVFVPLSNYPSSIFQTPFFRRRLREGWRAKQSQGESFHHK